MLGTRPQKGWQPLVKWMVCLVDGMSGGLYVKWDGILVGWYFFSEIMPSGMVCLVDGMPSGMVCPVGWYVQWDGMYNGMVCLMGSYV